MQTKRPPLPLFLQIAASIKKQIEADGLVPGERLPLESWYVEHFNASRVTIRKAIQELINDGVIERRPYHGLYVSSKNLNVTQANSPIYTFESSDVSPLITSEVLTFDVVAIPETLSKIFDCKVEDKLYYLNILRLNNGVPFSIQSIYLKKELLPKLDIFLLKDFPLHEIIEQKYGMNIGHMNVSMSVAIPTKEQARLLETSPTDSLLKATDTLFLSNHEVIRYANSLYTKSTNYSYTLYR